MADNRTIRCHQFLAGRFHEGYGRKEISREEVAGRKKQTIHYETINLEGRNNFCFDGYHAYEIEPTHEDWKQPGVFCITNATENGSQAARTYAVIPESGKIQDAFNVLRMCPEMPLDEFSEYDYAHKLLSWRDFEYTQETFTECELTETAEKRLGQFLAAYWNTMSERMVDPDNHSVIGLFIEQRSDDKEERFRTMVDFFFHVVVSKLPKAAQAMVSASFGVPWTQRRNHPAVACIVTSDEKDLNANPLYSFSVSKQNGRFVVDAGEHFLANEAESIDEAISEVLIGKRVCPLIYQNMERYFSVNDETDTIPDHIILRSYEIMSLLVGLELRKEEWDHSSDQSRPTKVAKTAIFVKKNYDVLYKTLTTNCGVAAANAFILLEPVLYTLLDIMGNIDEGTEFQNVFKDADIPFFAACRQFLENIQGKTPEEEASAEKLDRLLINNYDLWSRQGFTCILSKGSENTDKKMPMCVFLSISRTALDNNENEAETNVDAISSFFRDNYTADSSDPNVISFVEMLFKHYKKELSIGEDEIESWKKWLIDCGVRNDKKVLVNLMQPLYERAFQNNESVRPEYAAAFCNEMFDLLKNDDDRVAKSLMEKAQSYLADHFSEWSREDFIYTPGNQTISSELFFPVVQKWLDSISDIENEKQDEDQKILDTIMKIRSYCERLRDYPEENMIKVISSVFSWELNHCRIDRALYDDHHEWLANCRFKEKQTSALMLPLASKLFENEETMQQAGIYFVGEHMEILAKYKAEWEVENQLKADELYNREFNFLLGKLPQWLQEQAENGINYRRYGNQLEKMVEQWQNREMQAGNLNAKELESIRNTLYGIRKEDGTRMNLQQLEKQILYAHLKESFETCEKRCTAENLHVVAGNYQNFLPFKQDDYQYELLTDRASDLLVKQFIEWSKTDFRAGDREPDDCLIDLTEKWLGILNLKKKDQTENISALELKNVISKLEGLDVIRKNGETILCDLKDCQLDLMLDEAKEIELVDSDPEWLSALVSFYHGNEEDHDGNNPRYKKIFDALDEACSRNNQRANEYICKILEENKNIIPYEAKNMKNWNNACQMRLNEAIKKVFDSFNQIQDLTEKKLSERWTYDYSEDYSIQWQEIKGEFIKKYAQERLQVIYSETPEDDRIRTIQGIWDTTKPSGDEDNALSEIERSFVGNVLNQDYSELWKNADPDLRKELEAFTDIIIQAGYKLPDLDKSPASQACKFINEYTQKEKATSKEYGKILNTILKRPEWLQWICLRETDVADSAIEMAVKRRDLSLDGIGMRLIHDAAFERNDESGAYWKKIFSEVTGVVSFSDIKSRKTWTPENGRLLNALSYICRAVSALGEGGNEAMKDLKQWLSYEAPEFVEELSDEKKRRNFWANWNETLPVSLKTFLQINI